MHYFRLQTIKEIQRPKIILEINYGNFADPHRIHHPLRHVHLQAELQRVCDHAVAHGLPHRGHALLLDGRLHLQEEPPHDSQVQSGSFTVCR